MAAQVDLVRIKVENKVRDGLEKFAKENKKRELSPSADKRQRSSEETKKVKLHHHRHHHDPQHVQQQQNGQPQPRKTYPTTTQAAAASAPQHQRCKEGLAPAAYSACAEGGTRSSQVGQEESTSPGSAAWTVQFHIPQSSRAQGQNTGEQGKAQGERAQTQT